MNKFSLKYLTISLAFAFLASFTWPTNYAKHLYILATVKVFASSVAWLLSGVFVYLSLVPISRLHSALSAVIHFFILVNFYLVGWYKLRTLEKAFRHPKECQEKVLLNILKKNRSTEYGIRYKFDEITNRNQYRKMHPLTTYKDYEGYIEKIANTGKGNILISEQVIGFNTSSGTTGRRKMIPYSEEMLKYYIKAAFYPMFYLSRKAQSSISFLAPLKTAVFRYMSKPNYTDSGLPFGLASALMQSKGGYLLSINRTVPNEALVATNEPAQCYIHWLFALHDPDLCRIDGVYGGGMLSNFEYLARNYQHLANDIENGSLRFGKDIPSTLAENLLALYGSTSLKPNPRRAAKIREEFSHGYQGVIKRLWPKIDAITCCVTGSHSVNFDQLQRFLGQEIKIFTSMFSSSEAFFGINLDVDSYDKQQNFALLPNITFLEFIGENDISADQPDTLFLDELEVGKKYEIVTTSLVGFCRYRMGDIVEVVNKRHGMTPVVKFCARTGSILDVNGEKTTEDMVDNALRKMFVEMPTNYQLTDYTTTESSVLKKIGSHKLDPNVPPHYIVFVEAHHLNRPITNDEAAVFDKCLRDQNCLLDAYRQRNAMTLPKMITVKGGAFKALREKLLESTGVTVSNQYKTPKYLKSAMAIELLNNECVNEDSEFGTCD